MSQILEMTPADLRKAGWNALKERLGIPEALRFLLQYEKGEGDYTTLRRDVFKDETVDSLESRMKKTGAIGR